MKQVLGCSLAFGLLLAASAAHGDPAPDSLVSAFTRLCAEAHGDAALSLKIADAEGWTVPAKAPPPPSSAFGPVHVTSEQGRVRRSSEGLRVLLVTTFADGPHTGAACALEERDPVRDATTKAQDVRAEIEAWVGFKPFRSSSDGRFEAFAYRDVSGAHLPLARSYDPITDPRRGRTTW